MQFASDQSWVILSPVEQKIKEKIESVGIPLKNWDVHIYRGILTGFNEAFIINGETKDQLIAEDPKSAEIIRPILRGRDIKRYRYSFADLYVILAAYGSYKYLKDGYPAIYSHLAQYEEKLRKRGQCRYRSNGKPNLDGEFPGQHHWLELDNNPRQEYLDDFAKQKIIWGEISDKPKFALDLNGEYTPEATTFLMIGEKLDYLLGFLNSKTSEYFFSKNGTTTGVGTVRWKKFKIEQLPIPKVSVEQEKTLKEIVLSIISQPISNNNDLEDQLNKVIYSFYNFTDEEVQIIEQHCAQ